MKRAGCTIISPNYFAFARTLAGSYLRNHPEQQFYILIVADLQEVGPFQHHTDAIPVMLSEIGVPTLRAAAMRYDLLELNTNVKPTFLKYLLDSQTLDQVVYLDPDICVYQPLDPVFTALEQGATAVLTPHMTAPVFDGKAPSEQDLLYNGTYNLGFVAVGRSPESRRLLDWWEARCLGLGFSEGRTGLFVDQKWMNLAPGLFERVEISRDAGLNMAYWNLHERELVPGEAGPVVRSPGRPPVPLRFFHFSGLDLADRTVLSRNTNRFTLQDRPDLQPLFREYLDTVHANGGTPAETLPYGFDRFSDGTTITRLARRIFAADESRFTPDEDPFHAESRFARFAQAKRLVKGKVAPGKSTWKDFKTTDRRVSAVHRLLRWALRVLGPHRYELLMRYLAYISVLRHQAIFLGDTHGSGDAPSGRPVQSFGSKL